MIVLTQVTKKFGTGAIGLDEISVSIDKGEFVYLVGPTGSGKTTFFRLLIRDYLPTAGTILVGEWNINKLSKKQLPHLRKKVGVVFQDLKLLADRTIFENVSLPLDIIGIGKEEIKKRVEEVLEKVGISEHSEKFPVQLSGGELQRAAIARSLIQAPEIILADEPTGNLDSATSWEIVQLLDAINREGTTVIMATHNEDILKKLPKRVIGLDKGRIIRDEGKKPQKAEEVDKVEKVDEGSSRVEKGDESQVAKEDSGSENSKKDKEEDKESKSSEDNKKTATTAPNAAGTEGTKEDSKGSKDSEKEPKEGNK